MSILQNIKFYELEQNFWLLMIDSLIHKFTVLKRNRKKDIEGIPARIKRWLISDYDAINES